MMEGSIESPRHVLWTMVIVVAIEAFCVKAFSARSVARTCAALSMEGWGASAGGNGNGLVLEPRDSKRAILCRVLNRGALGSPGRF